ncbi:hypothetical protein FPV67DRAFT_1669576 [Lyophyllum atratum]|nr:hypothetical protein FPV67DRAFT_1669576 [Lyophyllum atratum]
MPPKRRILVVFEKGGAKRLKLAVSIDGEATNSALAQEVSETVGEDSVRLEIGEGFELRGQDTVDMILDSDIVTARPRTAQADLASSCKAPPSILEHDGAFPTSSVASTLKPSTFLSSYGSSLESNQPKILDKGKGRELGRFQICLVTPELARVHAKKTYKESTEPTNGILAFGGVFVNGNTTIVSVKCRRPKIGTLKNDSSSRRLDKKRPRCSAGYPATICTMMNHAAMITVGPAAALSHKRWNGMAFSRLYTVGLPSTEHDAQITFAHTLMPPSRRVSRYPHTKPYILSKGVFVDETLGISPPHCSVCADALAFPCPTCLERAAESGDEPSSVTHCPLVMNAGCGHLHHAHCLGPRPAATLLGCPSGCPRGNILREATPFDQDVPSIIVVWDGDKIDRIPVPSIYLPPMESDIMLRLQSSVVFSLVKAFLESKNLKLDGLSARIHARDPVTETVPFTWTTLVSVCPSVLHKNQDHRRFPFYENALPSNRRSGNGAKEFCIDFHTAQMPLMVCGCTRLADIFNEPGQNGQHIDTIATLYVVKRACGNGDTPDPKHSAVPVSKQSTYLLDSAWQPSTPQTDRGMAALLSSLFVLSHIVGEKGVTSEHAVLAALYAITRFPPAVRALGLLFLNVTPEPQEKAALSESLFHSLNDFSKAAPGPIVIDPSRRFETARIFLGYLLTITGIATTSSTRPLESFSLVCSLSQKRLTDPVLLDSHVVVERSAASYFVPGGMLHQPQHTVDKRSIIELVGGELRRVLCHTTNFHGSEIYGLRIQDIAALNRPRSLESAGYQFSSAIRAANESDLISRGPLELKSPAVVPPQIVLDGEGYLAVFTGRGCGATRDVNFFRPTSGGDTEVDVNDVEHALQKVIETRKREDTWEVDCFGGIPAKARVPDEAIMLCLDLSQSMNEKSGIGGSDIAAGHLQPFNHTAEARKAVADVLENDTAATIHLNAEEYIKQQHEYCHVAWQSWIEDSEMSVKELVNHLGAMALRDVLRIKSDGKRSSNGRHLSQLASFAHASDAQKETIVQFLKDFLEGTGDFLPPISRRSPSDVASSAQWVAGKDILNKLRKKSSVHPDFVTITLNHEGMVTSWTLPIRLPIRDLYSLAHRATRARYASFTLRMTESKALITTSAILQIEATDLRGGGSVELCRAIPHSRQLRQFLITYRDSDATQKILLPADASALALISHIRAPVSGHCLSEIQLWHGLHDAGDGHRLGHRVYTTSDISQYATLECHEWSRPQVASQVAREGSRSLTRLELLKELFNIFLNRVSSFDTSLSLVLGLVTFSDQAHVKQELTPIFENFRLELDKVTAAGNTAMYDALDVARSCLVNFRRDLPHLRRRIIIVSDGEDTSSTSSIKEVGSALQRDDITVDSVQVGQLNSRVLHMFSAATGGYRFFPQTSLGDALSIFDLETMMNSGERSTRPKMRDAFSVYQRGMGTLGTVLQLLYPIDAITIDRFPKRAEHPKLQERVKDVKKTRGRGVTSNDRTRRIMRELKALVTDPHPQIDVYVNDKDVSFLKVVIQAPDDIEQCPYKGGCFLLTCDLPAEYPRDAPEIRFVTFILHPNVSKQGKVCVAELGRLWSSDITLKELLSLVYGLLLEPDLENPLEIQASLKYYDDDGTFAHAAANAVKQHASKSRREWKAELEV